MLDDLDTVPWAGLTHAYGAAEDVPELLRAVGSPDADRAQEAVEELYGTLFHQGSVYPATAAAIPFLAELACHAAHQRDELVTLVGLLADPRHAGGPDFPEMVDAVGRQLPVLLTLLDDPDPEIRLAAVHAVTRAGGPALWPRWEVETDPKVRGSLALALGEVDPGPAASVLSAEAVSGAAPVRVAAAVALLRNGTPWPEGTVAALVDAIDSGASMPYVWSGTDWFSELMEMLPLSRGAELLRALLASPVAATRTAGLWAASSVCDLRRCAPATLVPIMAPALHDPDSGVRRSAAQTLAGAGSATGQLADELAEIARDVSQRPTPAAESYALLTLMRLGDPRWVALLCSAAEHGYRPGWSGPIRLTDPVLTAVRNILSAQPARADVLTSIIWRWGPDAAAAIPELVAALAQIPATTATAVAGALLALGHEEPAAEPHYRQRVDELRDLRSAAAIWHLTSDTEPILDLLGSALSGQRLTLPDSLTFLDELGPLLQPLVPAARALLTGVAAPVQPNREIQVLAARILTVTGDPDAGLSTLAAILTAGNTPARAAADLAGFFPVLEKQLRLRLTDPWARVAAARALARLGVPTAELAEPLVHGITDYAGRSGLPVILELQARETVPGLQRLVDADERLNVTGGGDIVWADELLRDQIRQAIAQLRE